ncbi:RpiB/LacA/LacB family sugar-phosphate isomerase [Candidatus Berkelbacteria bacterium]|nr:RpiB/LacA/LacB family sugar-phosphate isomerase [Candidatus Berkelbacteria bacterium]
MNHPSRIYIAADHNGFALKERLVAWLRGAGHIVEDLGASQHDPGDDYSTYGIKLGEAVAAHPGTVGIALCGSGQGIALAANKVRGVRAAVPWNPAIAMDSRTDDDANVLCLAADYLDQPLTEQIVQAWLATPFSGEARHRARIAEIERYEAQ